MLQSTVFIKRKTMENSFFNNSNMVYILLYKSRIFKRECDL
ncbi:hypothetical protein LEP1GSC186_0540 [Leptospira noguchii serovar Autumnalis str. ZUN142]|uniref:Uncharacterized protein n=1 Tax=Leptospira noguchii serovar Autumnalis str. ZUN142 TaxID=1085540 RepID=M6UAK7_9LEPT|nr:hypothetical protein LEP1GSC186_0540 [Leptospira noguchii serovar Autumnalis str. ZUN142]